MSRLPGGSTRLAYFFRALDMKRANALLKHARPSRIASLLAEATRRRPVSVVVRATPYKNKKGRVILELVRTTYVIRNGGRTLYGRKASSPKTLLKNAPRAIRPKKIKA